VGPVPAYVFLAEYVSNHDGDTVTLRLDHGRFPTSKAVTEAELRIRGLYCPELSEPGGAEARDFTRETLRVAQRLVVQTYRGSFARTVADIWVDGVPLTDLVIAAGHGSSSP
jgi:endonuclease YncB( thermonuclease family)